MYYGWSKEFLEAGKRRLAGDTAPVVAGRLNSNPEEPEPPFTKRLTSLKSSGDRHAKPPPIPTTL